ncbi:ribosomal protein L7/L12 [Nannocystis pusilla]|uniref:ribosomal protein L7/L12 n=1 Tax=Nannocystis pusilla TaxID=889268 RepID=UPI003BF0526A
MVAREDVIAWLSRLSFTELRDLLLELEDLWGMAPVYTPHTEPKYVFMGAAPYDPYDSDRPPVAPKHEVVLLSAGSRRVQVMKALREAVASLRLAEVMVLVEETPSVVLRCHSVHEAQALQAALEAVGAKVEIR